MVAVLEKNRTETPSAQDIKRYAPAVFDGIGQSLCREFFKMGVNITPLWKLGQ